MEEARPPGLRGRPDFATSQMFGAVALEKLRRFCRGAKIHQRRPRPKKIGTPRNDASRTRQTHRPKHSGTPHCVGRAPAPYRGFYQVGKTHTNRGTPLQETCHAPQNPCSRLTSARQNPPNTPPRKPNKKYSTPQPAPTPLRTDLHHHPRQQPKRGCALI